MICPSCGKEVKVLCSACWRCKDCEGDCKFHMQRTIDGVVGKNKELAH